MNRLRVRVRAKALRAEFERKNGHVPRDTYEKYILNAVINLGHVYDEVFTELQRLNRKPTSEKLHYVKTLDKLNKREHALHKLSLCLREAIGIRMIDSIKGPPYGKIDHGGWVRSRKEETDDERGEREEMSGGISSSDE